MNKRVFVVTATVLCCLLIASCGPSHRIISTGDGIQTDPAIIYRTLSNGFQYLLMENSVPDDRVFIYLDVFAGSLHESDDQQGVAHYLEHMLFNGSKRFKAGELVEYFQSIGMEFGSDANAHTDFFNTVYNLSLPGGEPKYLEDAFMVIEDYAEGASLLDSEIERERGIILAEKRERDSVSYRTFKAMFEFEFPGSLLNRRFPIGSDSVIRQANQNLLKAYYDKWYRPDNMALVVVGDFDAKIAENLIVDRFSKLSTRSFEINSEPMIRWAEHEKTNAFYHYEPEAGKTHVGFKSISWKGFEPENPESLKLKTLTEISNLMLQHRLDKMLNDQTGGFSDVTVFTGSLMRHVSMSAIQATCEPEKWQQTLNNIEYAVRQGIGFGFEKRELDRAKAEQLSDLDVAANQAGTQKSQDVAENILTAVNNKEMLISAKQRKTLLEPYINSISLKEVNDMFIKLWLKEPRLITVTGNAVLTSNNPVTEILDAYQRSAGEKLEKYDGTDSKKFPYLRIVEPSASFIKKKQDNVNGLCITTIDFSNNIRLNFKHTDYRKNEILFRVCFGGGKKSEPVSKPGLSFISQSVINKSGLGQLDADDMEYALAGHNINIKFDINEDHFSFSGACDPKETELMFQMIYHHLQDPGFRNKAFELSKIYYRQMYDSLVKKPEGIMQIRGDSFLGGNDTRFGFPDPIKVEQYSLNDVIGWLSSNFKKSPVEISIIGDVDIEKIIPHACKYLGALRDRENTLNTDDYIKKINFPEGKQLDLIIDSKIESNVVHIAFLTDDFWDISQTRRLGILSRVFSERLRLLIREELGESYSPYVYNDPSLIFDHYGVMHIVVNVKPEKHDFIYQKIKDVIDIFASEMVSDKEMNKVLKPVLNHLAAYTMTNEYWLNSVMANSYVYPQKFGWAKNMIEDYKSITSRELSFLAKKYLRIEKSALIKIISIQEK